MDQARRRRPTLEGQQADAVPVGRTLPVVGTVHGSYQARPSPVLPDTGRTYYYFSGNGFVSPLGRVRASRSMHLGGFIRPPLADAGDITLSNARGSITIHLQGAADGPGESVGSIRLDAEVIRSSGRYATALHGLGTATLRLEPSSPDGPTLTGPGRGTFQLSLALHPSTW